MKKILLLIGAMFIVSSTGYGQVISQYIETNSGSNPKGIEIWNNTGSTLDFSTNNLVIEKGTNGGAPSTDFTLSTGTLADGAVLVIGTSEMSATATGNSAAFHVKAFTFNGDDALVVKYGGVTTDVFGNPGSDPGSDWSGNGVSSANQNIQLKSGITTGDTDGFTDPSERFETVSTDPVNDDSGFGIAPVILGGAATKLVITEISPSSPTVGVGFDVTVQAQDGDDAVANVDGAVSITLTRDGGTGALSGTLTGTIADGTNSITISGVTFDTAETGVSITVTDDATTLTSGTSSTFTVVAVADQIVFASLPSSGIKNSVLTSFTVTAQRSGDSSTDVSYTENITISKVSGSGTLGGTLTKAAVAGVATFDDITFDADDDYTIQATDGSLSSAVSATITIDSPDFVETFETENFTPSGSYGDGSFTGVTGVVWTYVASRDDGGYAINGDNAIMLRRSSDNSSLTSNSISGGMKDFSIKLKKAFTGSGDRQVELFIGPDASNLTSLGTSTAFDDTEIHTFSVADINYVGNFVIRISNTTSSQINIDDISWNSYEDAEVSITGSAGYRLLSAPVTTSYSDVLAEVWTQGASTGADATNGDPNVFGWDRTTDSWEGYTNLDANVVAGTGFLVYVYADDNFDGTADAFPKTLSVSGTENAVDTAPTLNSANNGYTLVGNPFATTIDFDNATKNDLTNVAYVWDPNSGTGDGGTDANGGSGSWKTWNGTSGDLTDGLITPFQGFFVQNASSVTSPSITFGSGSKSSGGTFLGKTANAISQMKLNVEGNGLSNSAWLQVSDVGSAFDKVMGDANELNPLSTSYAQLAFQKASELLDIAHVDANDVFTLPIEFNSTRGGEFTFSASNFTLPSDVEVTFHDYQEGVSLRVDDSFNYRFEAAMLKAQDIQPLSIIRTEVFQAKASDDTRFALTVTPSTSVNNETDETASKFALDQNYPNPFNPTTTINYSVENAGEVNISVYNLMGQKVAELVNATKVAGSYNVTWNAFNVSSGMYYYRLEAGRQSITRKMTLIK